MSTPSPPSRLVGREGMCDDREEQVFLDIGSRLPEAAPHGSREYASPSPSPSGLGIRCEMATA